MMPSRQPERSRRYLLRYHAAGNAIARVSRRISLHVILFGMNDHRRSTVTEKRMAIARIFQVHVLVSEFHGSLAVWLDDEVQHVSSVVAFGALQAVLLAIWIEMWAGGLEVGTIALGILMEVNAVFAWSQIMQLYIEYDALGSALR